MAEERVQRRLAAILAADVVGYSRLMEADEAGTRARLRSLHSELIDPRIAADGGRIVKTTGDGILVEFPSAVDAVRNALDIQHAVARRNAGVAEDKRIVFRIGVNLGDVIVEGDDIHGDGVNVAARLEGLCAPGEVYLSGSVHDHVEGKLEAAFDDLGEQAVKNITRPIRVYRVRPAPQAARGPDEAGAAPPLPARASVAVMPFNNISGDPEQEYFADGMTEDLITDLSKISGLFVVARNSSFAYKGQKVDIREVGRQLGVRHVLEGSVRKVGERVRINAQLIDAATGGHLWAERYDGVFEDIFVLQDEITAQIVSALEVNLTAADQSRAERRLTDDVGAYDLFLQGRVKFHLFTPEGFDESIRLFEGAIEIDPDFAAAYAYIGIPLQSIWSFMWPGYEDSLARALDSTLRAVDIDDRLGLAHMGLGWVQIFCREHEAAIASFERAVALDPNMADPYAYFAEALNYAGDPERAIENTQQALRFDPLIPPNCAFHLGHSNYLLRRYDQAADTIRHAIDRAPTFPVAHLFLAAVYAEMGRREDAAAEAEATLKLAPRYRLETINAHYPYRSRETGERLVSALRAAGFPE